MRRLLTVLALLLGWIATAVLATAAPAAAHAELVSSTPASAARLTTAPPEITLTFTESVTLVPSALRLLDATGASLPLGDAGVVGGTVTVELPGELDDGGYVFVYRVISGDSHPIAGALPFTVGAAATAADTAVLAAAVGADGDALVSGLGGLTRWLSYTGVVLLLGVPAFGFLCRRSGAADPMLTLLTLAGGALVGGTALVGLPIQAARVAGGGVGSAFEDGALRAVLDTTYGQASIGRVALTAVVVTALAVARDRPRPAPLLVAAAAGAGLLLTFSRVGHPAVGDYPAATMALDAVHLGAVALWIGGLVVLAVRVLPHPPADAAAVLSRWSPVAMTAVAVLAVTGSAQAWRELRSVTALVDTEYGRWILVKVVGLALLVALGEFGRRRVRRLAPLAAPGPVPQPAGASLGAALADRTPAEISWLRRSVGLELALAAGILAASAVLVVTTPGSGSAAAAPVPAAGSAHPAGHGSAHPPGHTGPVYADRGTVELPNDVRVELSADPATPGAAVLTITTIGLDGELIDPPEVTLTAAQPAAGIAPIDLLAQRSGTGTFRVDGSALILPGTWKFTVTVRTTDVDAGVGEVLLELR